MFDTIKVGGGTQYVHSSVTEKRAPTDESVRLLAEMEAAAEKRVIERGNSKCPNTNLEIRWTCIHDQFDPDVLSLNVFFSINGKDRHLEIKTCPLRFSNQKEKFMDIHTKVTAFVAETISMELIKNGAMAKTLLGR
jgi:hypothetical protein